MRALLLGTGYVGMSLISSWKDLNVSFIATTTTESKLAQIQVQTNVEQAVFLDIRQFTDLKSLIDGCDVVIVTVAPNRGASYRDTYLVIALSISHALKGIDKPLFLLYTSSTSVYGNQEGTEVSENSKRAPLSDDSKVLCEAEDIYLSCASPMVKVCVLRLGGIYGPERSLEQRAAKMSQKILSGSGLVVTNHIHLEDITGAIEFCVKIKLSGVYNLVNNDHPSRETLYNQICTRLEIGPPIWGGDLAQGSVTNALVTNEKIKNAGYAFKHPCL